MLIVRRKEGESIDRMLKRYKRKHKDAKIRDEALRRKTFTKPSDKRRKEIAKATYSLKKKRALNG